MDVLLLILIIMCIGAFLAVLTWVALIILNKDEENISSSFIINLMPQYTFPEKGHMIGLEQSTKKIDGRYLIEFSPRDINANNLKNNSIVNNCKIVVDKDKVLSLPRGTSSDFRSVKILF